MIRAENIADVGVDVKVDGTGADLIHEFIAISRIMVENMKKMDIDEESGAELLHACVALSIEPGTLRAREVTKTDFSDLIKAALNEYKK